jgi:CHAT domain-containing protein/tetratricopeptide (TPR) repeat protein
MSKPDSPLGKRPTNINPEQLMQTILVLVQAKTWDQAQGIVTEHPELLTDTADAMLSQLAELQHDKGARQVVHEHRTMLRRSREIGVAQAFAEKLGYSGPPVPAFFLNDFQRAQQAQALYPHTGNPQLLMQAIAIWSRIQANPVFSTSPKRFRTSVFNELGLASLLHYRAQSHMDDLNRALACFQKAVQDTPLDSPDRPVYLNNLGNCLSDRYTRTGSLQELEASVRAYQDAAQTMSSGSPQLPMLFNNLGNSLIAHYIATGQGQDLEEAIHAHRKAVQIVARNSQERPMFLNSLGNSLSNRYAVGGRPSDLEEAIDVCQEAVQATPVNSPFRPMYLANLGRCLYTRYGRSGQPEDLKAAIGVLRTAVQTVDPRSPDRPLLLDNLGGALRDRYAVTGQLGDLEEAIRTHQLAAETTPNDSPARPSYLMNLGISLYARYGHTGRLADLESAVRIFQEVAGTVASDSPNRASYLSYLGAGLSARYAVAGKLEDLEEAIHAYRESLRVSPLDSPHRPQYLDNLSTGLFAYYQRSGNLDDLEAAVQAAQQAVQNTPLDAPQRPEYLNSLGTCLRTHYQRTGVVEDLEAAIDAFTEAIQKTPPGAAHLCTYFANLGGGLLDRYQHTGNMEDLEEAIRAYREGVRITPGDTPNRPLILTALAAGLAARHARLGRPEDLEEVVKTSREAAQGAPAGSPDRPTFLVNVGNSLRDRYARHGRLEDLEEAISIYREVVQSTSHDSPERPIYLNSLAGSLLDRYRATDRLEDLEESIRAFQEAVETTAAEAPSRPMYLNNLGTGFRDRFAHTRRLDDLSHALTCWQEAMEITSPGSPDFPMYATNLGAGLLDRHKNTGRLDDLDEAIRSLRQAVQVAPVGSPVHPMCLNNLGVGLRERYKHSNREEDLQQAVAFFESTCKHGLEISLYHALEAAHTWGSWAFEREEWTEASQALAYGLEAVDRLYHTQLLRRSKETWLRRTQDLHTRAAFALARSGDLQGAVLALERGRARLLAEVLERDRADLVGLEISHPDLYEGYRQAIDRVDLLEGGELRPETLPDGFDLVAEMRLARGALDAAVEGIRRVPDYQGFLSRPDLDEVLNATGERSALIYLLTIPSGSLALIAYQAPETNPPATGVEPYPLAVTAVWANDFAANDLDSLLVQYDKGEMVGGYLPGQLSDPQWLRASLDEVLSTLGQNLLGPVATCLRTLGISSATLVPAGRLGILPLHAARYQCGGQQIHLLDEFDVAFAPSARVLGHCRDEKSLLLPRAPSLFAVSDPQPLPPSAKLLGFAVTEVEEIVSLFGEQAVALFREQATLPAVLEAMPGSTYIHLACHGRFEPEAPLASGLMLSGGESLTLATLLDQISLQGARLAVLAACQTAITDFEQVPDEVIGLPAGFLQAGVPGVVGTLWPVNDLSTALLMAEFYRRHSEKGQGIAHALRGAQRWLRDLGRDEVLNLVEPLRERAQQEDPDLFRAIDPLYWQLLQGGEKYEHPFAHPYYWGAFTASGAV